MNRREIQLRFPAYMIGVKGDEFGRVAAQIDGREWFLLYQSLELAELYIEKFGGPSLLPLRVNVSGLHDALVVEPKIAGFVLNCLSADRYLFLDRTEFEG